MRACGGGGVAEEHFSQVAAFRLSPRIPTAKLGENFITSDIMWRSRYSLPLGKHTFATYIDFVPLQSSSRWRFSY